MFELETILKSFNADDDGDIEIPMTLDQAREIVQQFSHARTALRRIISLEDKNVPRYAKSIAQDGLRLGH